MYRCLDCEKEFEEPDEYPGMSGEYWGKPFQEYYQGCPYCKSDNIAEIKYTCDCCSCNIAEGDECYETKDGCIYCEDCIIKKEA